MVCIEGLGIKIRTGESADCAAFRLPCRTGKVQTYWPFGSWGLSGVLQGARPPRTWTASPTSLRMMRIARSNPLYHLMAGKHKDMKPGLGFNGVCTFIARNRAVSYVARFDDKSPKEAIGMLLSRIHRVWGHAAIFASSDLILDRSRKPDAPAGEGRGELELELIQPHMAQKPVLRGEVGCACVGMKPVPIQ